MTAKLILASASPRRRELLAAAGIEFSVDPSSAPEIPRPGEAPAAFARRVAIDKAADVARRHPGAVVLGADTVVTIDDRIFGKPRDRDEARRMLTSLSDRTHIVLTAVAIIDGHGVVEDIEVETQVDFRALSAAEIETYLDSGEPFDKAGAYAVQGLAARFVRELRGSRSNVIGLPMEATMPLLQKHGITTRQ